jgi:5,6,7,8-tetrahydromethanopterin hydro-lyase
MRGGKLSGTSGRNSESMSKPFTMRVGEATVFAKEGQFTDAMAEIVIGALDGPVGLAFANLMGQTAGHSRMFAVRDCNQMARPPTMMVPKVTIKDSKTIELLGSVVQAATADAVVDCVADGTIARAMVDEICIIDLIWLDPQAVKDPNLDRKDLYRTNYEATRMAITRALKGEPTVDELIGNRRRVKHVLFDPDA